MPVNITKGRDFITNRAIDVNKTKTPSLRAVNLTAPYMHDGSLTSLEDVVDHYIQTSRTAPVGVDTDLTIPIVLTGQEKQDLIEFLKAL
jgi:cytochrome c peroxidase